MHSVEQKGPPTPSPQKRHTQFLVLMTPERSMIVTPAGNNAAHVTHFNLHLKVKVDVDLKLSKFEDPWQARNPSMSFCVDDPASIVFLHLFILFILCMRMTEKNNVLCKQMHSERGTYRNLKEHLFKPHWSIVPYAADNSHKKIATKNA